MKAGLKAEIKGWIVCIVIAVIIAFLVSNFVIINSYIPSPSMESTVMTGDRLIAFRTSYWFADPKRGDIIVFKYPDNPKKLYIKRVIGEPGDKVEIKNGNVFINDSKTPLNEPYLNEAMGGSYGPYHVPEKSYFVMGDNRNYSEDSRAWKKKYVDRDAVLGKAKLQYYPKIRLIN